MSTCNIEYGGLFQTREKPKFKLRDYQEQAVKAGINYFQGQTNKNAIIILPTGSGKSIVIANIITALKDQTIILQPSKEILEQNYSKYCSYGYQASIYSASAGQKLVSKVTFCTIGSIIKKTHLFKEVKNIIIDECHLVNPNEGMYQQLINTLSEAKVLGLTATPYRLHSSLYGSELRFITRTRPRVFHEVLYYVQNKILFDSGYLTKLEYFSPNIIDRSKLVLNNKNTDFTEESVRRLYKSINMPSIIVHYAMRLLKKRKNLLIFCSLIEEAKSVTERIPGSALLTGATKKEERERILSLFKKGEITCVVNVGVLTTGFDYPGLEVVLIARSTLSLALYYQMIGRAMRIAPNKDNAWIVDLGGNIEYFGKIETMKINQTDKGYYYISNNGRSLTNVKFQR